MLSALLLLLLGTEYDECDRYNSEKDILFSLANVHIII